VNPNQDSIIKYALSPHECKLTRVATTAEKLKGTKAARWAGPSFGSQTPNIGTLAWGEKRAGGGRPSRCGGPGYHPQNIMKQYLLWNVLLFKNYGQEIVPQEGTGDWEASVTQFAVCVRYEQIPQFIGIRPQRATAGVRQQAAVIGEVRGGHSSKWLVDESCDLEHVGLAANVQLLQHRCDILCFHAYQIKKK